MPKLLLVDDHAVVRKGIGELLADKFPKTKVTEAADEAGLYEGLKHDSFDLLILDIGLPGKNGLDILKDLKMRHPDLPVLIFSMFAERDYGPLCFKAGASGYLSKGSDPEELAKAVSTILDGNMYISSQLSSQIAQMLLHPTEMEPHRSLSLRELQVFAFIAQGKSLKEIASQLKISVKTVGTYRNRILTKMQMTTNADLIRYAIEHNLQF